MCRVALGLLVGICAWSLAGPARAQEVPPANAPVVASVPGAALVAFDHGTDLCVGLQGARPASCDGPPHGIFDPFVQGTGSQGTSVLYGVTSTDAATIEVLALGTRVTAAVSAGAYTGRFAGRVRFFLVAISGEPYRVLLRDAQGRVVGGTDLGSAPAMGHPLDVEHGRLDGRRWRTVVYQTTRLDPTPLDPAHLERLTCVRTEFDSEQRGIGASCVQLGPAGASITPREHCDPDALLIDGLISGAVRSVEAVLGDGTRQRARLDPLPARLNDPRRVFVLVLGPDTAVRELRIRAGARMQRIALGQAPGGATCRGGLPSNVGWVAYSPLPIGAQPGPVGPLVARDDGDRLCVGLGTIVTADCQLPPTDARIPRIDLRRAGGHAALLAVVPPEVARLRLTIDRGAPVTVATTDLPGYSGRYAGLVRAATVALPAGSHVYGTEELAADGHVIEHWPGPDLRPLAHTPAVLARLPGGIVAAAGGTCIQVGANAPTRDRTACRNADLLKTLVAAPCAARRLVIVTRRRALRVTTDRGVIRGHRKGRFTVAVVPRDAALRSPVRLPPASKQCGYTLQT